MIPPRDGQAVAVVTCAFVIAGANFIYVGTAAVLRRPFHPSLSIALLSIAVALGIAAVFCWLANDVSTDE